MIQVHKEKKVRYTPKAMYDLVNDTERYSEFVPFCQKSEVLLEKDLEKLCRLTFSKGPISRVLETRNILTPGEKIEIFLHRGDFKHLEGSWVFLPDPWGCQIEVAFQYVFIDPMVEYIFGPIFNRMTDKMVDIFTERADAILR